MCQSECHVPEQACLLMLAGCCCMTALMVTATGCFCFTVFVPWFFWLLLLA